MVPQDETGLGNFFKVLEELRSRGIEPPEGSLGVLAFDGDELQGVSERFEVNRCGGTSEPPDSSSALSALNGSSENLSLPHTPHLQSDRQLETGISVSDQRPPARGGRHRKQATRKRKLDMYFEKHVTQEGDIIREQYKCLQCSFIVTQKKPRERIFHVMLCPVIPTSTRWHYYKQYSDAGMPPFFTHPPSGLTARSARRLFAEAHKKMVSRLSCLQMRYDPTREPRMGQYLLAKQKVKKSTPIGKCSEEESKVARALLMQFIIEENVPFAACDNHDNQPRPLGRLLSYLRPGFKMPLGYRVRGSLLNEYYNTLSKDVRGRLQSLMRESRGTVMFDGSEDINGAPMVNILLRVMGSARISTTTFFLTTIYTGYDTVDAAYYVDMTEKVLERFGGFANIAAVVTDNTGCVRNAREELQRKYPRLVASQDQAHVADRLMGDIGDIEWIQETLASIASIASVLRRLRKLRARLIELMREYNSSLREAGATADGPPAYNDSDERTTQLTSENFEDPASEVAWEEGVYERDMELSRLPLDNSFSRAPGREMMDQGELSDDESGSDGRKDVESPDNTTAVPSQPVRTAVTIKRLSNVRFASSEGLLDEFIRTRPVLVQLVNEELFPTLYTARNESDRLKRERSFREPILDKELLRRATQVHRIFRACRVYLRVFDSETSIASEVFEATRILKDTLERMPMDTFPVPREENKRELLEVFENRMRGPLPGRKRIQISLISDLHIAAALLDPYRTPSVSSPYMEAFRRHLNNYLSGLNMSMLGIDEESRGVFFEEMVNQYLVARAIWESEGIMRETSHSSCVDAVASEPMSRMLSTRSPIAWWCTGALSKPSDMFQRKAVEELIEFAIRTLSVSPTATATERTFSLENRIHTTQRANLAPEKVRKLLFCQWNSRVLRSTVRRDEIDVRMEAERQVEGIRKLRTVRSSVLDAARSDGCLTSSADRQTISDDNLRESAVEDAGENSRIRLDGHVALPSVGNTCDRSRPSRTFACNPLDSLSATDNIGTETAGQWLTGMFRAALRGTLLQHNEEQLGSTHAPPQMINSSNAIRYRNNPNPSNPIDGEREVLAQPFKRRRQ